MKNFGRIKKAFAEIISEGVIEKNPVKKDLFKKYLKALQESKILKLQYFIYDNIENGVDSDVMSANIFLDENLKLIQKYKNSDIIAENKKLCNLSQQVAAKSKGEYSFDKLHESIASLIFTKTNHTNVTEATQNRFKILTHIQENKKKEVTKSEWLGPTMYLAELAYTKFDKKYSELNEDDKKVLNVILKSNKEEKRGVYTGIVRECIDIIDINLNKASIDNKDKLLKVKDKLLRGSFIDEQFNADIAKLLTLKKNLTNSHEQRFK